MLLEILSRWPRYFNQGPAAEMWSVVHFPLTLIRIVISSKSFPSHLSKGVNNWSLCDLGSTSTATLEPSFTGCTYVSWPGSKPLLGSSSPKGGVSLNFFPSQLVSWSVKGLKSSDPAMLKAVTNSGEVTKQWVAGLASLRPVKFLLYEVTIVFFSPFLTSFLSHWPMQGPQALASTYKNKKTN